MNRRELLKVLTLGLVTGPSALEMFERLTWEPHRLWTGASFGPRRFYVRREIGGLAILHNGKEATFKALAEKIIREASMAARYRIAITPPR